MGSAWRQRFASNHREMQAGKSPLGRRDAAGLFSPALHEFAKTHGVRVSSIDSELESSGIKPGMYFVEIGGQQVANLGQIDIATLLKNMPRPLKVVLEDPEIEDYSYIGKQWFKHGGRIEHTYQDGDRLCLSLETVASRR